jgi:hypothetical protein
VIEATVLVSKDDEVGSNAEFTTSITDTPGWIVTSGQIDRRFSGWFGQNAGFAGE